MRKFLRIIEYSMLGKIPAKESFEHEFIIGDKLFRTSVCEAEDKEQIKENFDPYYNDSKLEEKSFALNDVLIFDDLDVQDPAQKLVYVFECPVCLNKIITTEDDFDFCPQCEQEQFPFDLIALINTEQMEELAIDNPDVTTLVLIKDDEIVFKDTPKEEELI